MSRRPCSGRRARSAWVGLLARLVVGGVWIWAGLLKLPHPEASVTAVRAYQLLLARRWPRASAACCRCSRSSSGRAWCVGLLARARGVVSALLQLAFIIGIASVWSRGISINCGCFGDGGPDPDAFSKYPWEIARDTGLLLLSLLVVWLRRTPLALDNLLFPNPTRTRDVEEGT